MSKGENIVKWIKGQRISRLGHLERMEEDSMLKKIFTQELEGTRGRGRPRKGWREEVQDVQLKSGPYFNMSNLFTKISNMLYYTINLYLQ